MNKRCVYCSENFISDVLSKHHRDLDNILVVFPYNSSLQWLLFVFALVTIGLGIVFHQTFWVKFDNKSFIVKIMSQKWRIDTLCGVVGDDKIKAFLSIILGIGDYEFSSVLELIPKYVCICQGIIFECKMYFTLFCSTLTTFGVNIVFISSKKMSKHIADRVRLCMLLLVFVVKRNFVCESKFSWWLSRVGKTVISPQGNM